MPILKSLTDRTASGPSDCTDTVSDCKAVYTYLDSQSKAMSSCASSPLWSVVDGPWKLQSFNADGHVTFVPNKSYSGPVKPTLTQFKEVPFTTESAEYNVLPLGQRQPEAERRLPADDRRPEEARERCGRREPGLRGTRSTRCTRGASTTSCPTQTPPRRRARSSSSCTSGRRWRT